MGSYASPRSHATLGRPSEVVTVLCRPAYARQEAQPAAHVGAGGGVCIEADRCALSVIAAPPHSAKPGPEAAAGA